MALRSLYFVVALTMLIASGCRRTANYQPPPCAAPAVVATVPVPPPCPPGQIPPPGTVIVPR